MATLKPSILLDVESDPHGSIVVYVAFGGLLPGERVELSFIENDGTADARIRPERVLGTAAGQLVPLRTGARLGFVPDAPPNQEPPPEPTIRFRLESLDGASDYVFQLSPERFDVDEGDAWHVLVRADSHSIDTAAIPVARVRRQVEAGGAAYDWHAGHDVEFYNDGSTDAHGSGGAFHDLLAAIRAARHFVFVVDWSFQPLFCPSRSATTHRKGSIGALLIEQAIAHPELLVAIHTWNHTGATVAGHNIVVPDVPNDHAPATFDRLARDFGLAHRPRNLLWRASSRTGVSGSSHHQKFVVFDAPGSDGRRELKVFFGGLDLTKGRFDWPAHLIEPSHPEALGFRHEHFTADSDESTDDWYNPEFGDRRDLPRQPWHDIHGSLAGPAAWDFVREFVGRWNVEPSLGGDIGDLSRDHVEAVWSKFRELHAQRDKFVQQFDGLRTGRWSAQVYRSLALEHWATPARDPRDSLDQRLFGLLRGSSARKTEHSILGAYRQNIDRAERFIYIENQYFMGSGKYWKRPSLDNDLPERLVQRILQRAGAKKPFHVYIVLPMFPEGDPVSIANREVRLNEWLTIEYMVKALHSKLGKAWPAYLSFYFLANWRPIATAQRSKSTSRMGRVRAHMRYMVYVHSKLMLVDDRYALFGSCNLNDRGLSGSGDSEIACGIWPSHGEETAAVAVQRFRKRLWLEHFGELVPGADKPESALCVSSATAHAQQNYFNFRTMAAPPRGHICRLPLLLKDDKLKLQSFEGRDEYWDCLPDSPERNEKWRWPSNGSSIIRILQLAE